MKPGFVLLSLIFIMALLAAPISAGAARAANADFSVLDSAIQAQMDKHGLPGVALAVIAGDQIVHLKGYGTAGSHAMTPQTQMFIGSQSKSFTALAIARLVDQGKLDLNTPVRAYIPWFKVADEQASKLISINHLLHHTSGLSESGYSILLPANATPEEAVRSLASARLTAPIGAKFQYFNVGYDVLAYLVEIVTGETYADTLQENVFNPLGMTRSTADPLSATDLSWGYTRLFGFAVPMQQPVRDYEIGAGYIISTAEDMARYAIAMKNNHAGLVSPGMARKMFSPGAGAYGMGWNIVDGGQKIFHGGANETFRTEVMIYPGRDLAFVLLVNEGHLADHYISAAELTNTVETIVLGSTPPSISRGWSVRWLGWGLGILVLLLTILHTYNFFQLKSWTERTRSLSPAKKALDVAISFMIPTIILIVVFSQLKSFFDYRFNLLTSIVMLRFSLPDVFILMIVGIIPDYAQGILKLVWILTGKKVANRNNP